MSEPRSERWRKAGWSALTLLMFLAFLEILARRVGAPAETRNIEMDFNADLLWELRDDPRKGPEYRVNALGLRGPELEPGGTLRVMSTGDSSIYGHSVRVSEVFTSVLADRVEALRPGVPVEGVIGGIPGYSSYQSLKLLARVGEAVVPDVLVIGNMWSDAYQSAITDADWAGELRAAYGPWAPITRPLALLSERSYLARNVRHALHERFYPARGRAHEIGWIHLTKPDPGLEDPTETTDAILRREAGARAAAMGGEGTGSAVSVGGAAPPGGTGSGKAAKGEGPGAGKQAAPPGRETHRVPVADYAANLKALVDRARQLGALPVFLMLPHPHDPEGVTENELRYRETMRRVAADEGVPLADAAARFLAMPTAEPRFADDIHPNARGHAAIAQVVLEALATSPAHAARLGIPAGAVSAPRAPPDAPGPVDSPASEALAR